MERTLSGRESKGKENEGTVRKRNYLGVELIVKEEEKWERVDEV